MKTVSPGPSGRLVLTAMILCLVAHMTRGQVSVASAPFSSDTRWITFIFPASQEPKTSETISSSTLLSALPIFRREFVVDKEIAGATLTMSGLGQYEAHINGQEIAHWPPEPAASSPEARITSKRSMCREDSMAAHRA